VRRVLFLAYYFPPHGGAGVQRTVKFLKNLPSHGYEAVVVAGPATTKLDWAPWDETLEAEIPAGTEIHRVAGPEPTASSGWRGRGERWLRLRDPFSRWWVEGASALGLELARGCDLVYASMSPFDTAVAAGRIASATGKPWVADLRDPWALDEWTVFPTGAHRRLEERAMRHLLADADALILNTPDATSAVLASFPELATRRIETIPNGWDRADFADPPPVRGDAAFRIVYVGYAHVTAGRRHSRTRVIRTAFGGAMKGLDVLARSHVFLLEALDRLVAEQPELRSRIELHIAGAHGAAGSGAAHPLVRLHEYLSHPRAIALMRSADLLFLPMHDLAPGVRARAVPGKTYEYLAARRPILAALPDGDARDLLSGWPETHLCRPRAVDCLIEAVRAHLADPRSRAPFEAPELLWSYERNELTRRLAALFDAVIGQDGPPPTVPLEQGRARLVRGREDVSAG
jgi:hypothetical protein